MGQVFEINVDEYFNSYYGDELIRGLLENGWVLILTPLKYNENKRAIMIDIVERNDDFE